MTTSNDTTKRCTKCGEEKPATVEYFYRSKTGKNGLYATCKQCQAKYKCQQRLTNHEKVAEYKHQWYLANREKTIERSHQRHLANREKRAEHAHRYYLENREKKAEYDRQYRAENPDRILARNHRRRARKRALPVAWTEKDWLRCLAYWHHRCAVCGYPFEDLFSLGKKQADHWIPLNDRRPDNPGTVPENMLPLCSSCNQSKYHNDPVEWLVSRYGKRKANQILKRIAEYFEWIQTPKELDNATD